MGKLYILVVVSCHDGVTQSETQVFTDKTEANICCTETFKYYFGLHSDLKTFDYCDQNNNISYDIGEISDKFWARCEIQEKRI